MAFRAAYPQAIAVRRKGGGVRMKDAGFGIQDATETLVATYIGEVVIPRSLPYKRTESLVGLRTMMNRVFCFAPDDNGGMTAFNVKIEDELTTPDGTVFVVLDVLRFPRTTQAFAYSKQ